MNTRRSVLKSLLAAPLAFLFKPLKKQKSWPYPYVEDVAFQKEITKSELAALYPRHVFSVQTLEHDGWGAQFLEGTPSTQYMTRWTFSTHEKAEEFVRSLTPRITSIWLQKSEELAQIRSGYREAIRAQFRGSMVRYTAEIASRQSDNTFKSVELHRPQFTDVEEAWSWLSNIRIDGEPVSRKGRTGLSEYLTRPFIKGEPKIHYV